MKILYFTSTGNCLSVAKRFDAELLSVPQLIRQGQYTIEDDVVGIITPTYGFALPAVMYQYLPKCTIKANYVFVIATYGNICGSVLHEVKKQLEKNGNHADYYETLLMVDNYLPQYEVNKQISMLEQKGTEMNMQRIVDEVISRVKKDENRGWGWNLLSAAMAASSGATKTRAKRWFRVSDACISCGICTKICPVSNVVQTAKEKPIFGKECISCFACTHNCPQNAIRLTNERSTVRFRNPEVSLKEIIQANTQQ